MASDLDYQVEIFGNRLAKRHKHLWKWARKNDVSCFRVYDRDIPEIPLVVDKYDSYLHIAEFHSPHKNLPGTPEEWSSAMQDAARRVLGIKEEHVAYKVRRKTGRNDQYERVSRTRSEMPVQEGGLTFLVNLWDYIDTGLFLDHRATRSMVREIVQEIAELHPPRVMNLFSYTGSFSVYAASGGASETVSVDMSNTYSDWARRNMEANGFAGHRIENRDVFEFLENESRAGGYDLIVIDPPTFSNSKKMSRILDIQRDHQELLGMCARFLKEDGLIVFSTNKRDFKMADRLPEGLTASDISKQTIPQDFRDPRIHRCWLVERKN